MAILLNQLGSLSLAESVARRAERSVAAYRDLVSTSGTTGKSFTSRPLIDKAGYLRAHALRDLVGDDFGSTFSIIASSGSSGKPFYWPQLRADHEHAGPALVRFLEAGFDVHRRRTMGVVGLALGSWIGGDAFSWALKNAALSVRYPLAVFSPGNHHAEIIHFIADAEPLVDQILLVVCPSAIGHLRLLAESLGLPLPWAKMRFLVIGEPFPESLRASIRALAGPSAAPCPILSVYGSADTGVLGSESPASAAARQILDHSPALCREIGLPSPAPHLFHVAATDVFLETVNDELCVTHWQGIPLVRYNLHDSAKLVSWAALRSALLAAGADDAKARGVLERSGDGLPDVIAIAGRADRCLILCGTNLTEPMLDSAVLRAAAAGLPLTGRYRAAVTFDQERQRLALDVEVKGARTTDLADRVYAGLIQSLGEVQPEFHDDWVNVYRVWDDDPERRIIRLTVLDWPALSGGGAIKSRGIAP